MSFVPSPWPSNSASISVWISGTTPGFVWYSMTPARASPTQSS